MQTASERPSSNNGIPHSMYNKSPEEQKQGDSQTPSRPRLSDVTEAKLKTDIAKALKIEFLSEATTADFKWPVIGIFWGPRLRAMANMIVTTNNKNINVFFIVDTGSPIVAISNTTCNALKIRDTSPIPSLGINGKTSNVQLSTNEHTECNMLGAEYFHPIVEAVLNYRTKQVLLRLVPSNTPTPNDEFKLNDVDEHIMETEISEKLGIKYLSSADDVTVFPNRIEGVIWSQMRRPIANLIVDFKGRKVNVFFIIDTGAPGTYITEKTMKELGFELIAPSTRLLKINNRTCEVKRSVGKIKERNVLGTDYFNKSVELTYNYPNEKVILNFL